MRTHVRLLAFGLTLLATAHPGTAQSAGLPAGAALRWAFGHSSSETPFGDAPSLVMTLSHRSGLAVWSGATYLHEAREYASYSYFGESYTHPYTRYLPITAGLRASNVNAEGRPQGPFVEAGPSLTPAWYRDVHGSSGFAMMGGLQAGVGISLPSYTGTRVGFGVSYYLAEAFGQPEAAGRIGIPNEADVRLVTAYVSLGLGD